MGTAMPHRRHVRWCKDCLAGEHYIHPETWRTDFLLLVRRICECVDCDCTFCRVIIKEPRFDQRHHRPHVHRKRRTGGRQHATTRLMERPA
jgi:hypothetical protein